MKGVSKLYIELWDINAKNFKARPVEFMLGSSRTDANGQFEINVPKTVLPKLRKKLHRESSFYFKIYKRPRRRLLFIRRKLLLETKTTFVLTNKMFGKSVLIHLKANKFKLTENTVEWIDKIVDRIEDMKSVSNDFPRIMNYIAVIVQKIFKEHDKKKISIEASRDKVFGLLNTVGSPRELIRDLQSNPLDLEKNLTQWVYGQFTIKEPAKYPSMEPISSIDLVATETKHSIDPSHINELIEKSEENIESTTTDSSIFKPQNGNIGEIIGPPLIQKPKFSPDKTYLTNADRLIDGRVQSHLRIEKNVFNSRLKYLKRETDKLHESEMLDQNILTSIQEKISADTANEELGNEYRIKSYFKIQVYIIQLQNLLQTNQITQKVADPLLHHANELIHTLGNTQFDHYEAQVRTRLREDIMLLRARYDYLLSETDNIHKTGLINKKKLESLKNTLSMEIFDKKIIGIQKIKFAISIKIYINELESLIQSKLLKQATVDNLLYQANEILNLLTLNNEI